MSGEMIVVLSCPIVTAVIFCLVKWLDSLFKKEDKSSKAWCECGHETLQDPLSKIYDGGTFTNIICSNCNRQTTWDLDSPVPLKLSSIP